jgi:membrane protease YdiL (CAAX protease family)
VRPTAGARPSAPADRRLLGREVLLVLALSLGADAIGAVISFIGSATSGRSLASQTAVLVGNPSPGRPLLGLVLSLFGIAVTLVPVALVAHLLGRGGESMGSIGVDVRRPGLDLAGGAALAAVIGGAGLGLYLAGRALGLDLTVVPSTLPAVWWRTPVLVLSAAQNGLLEEVVVAGYLLHRLRQMGWSDGRALATSAVLRGSYHLYQGVGGFAGNLAMGLIFGRIYQRTGRAAPLVVAHTLIDAGAFVGYVYLVGKVGWLPRP